LASAYGGWEEGREGGRGRREMRGLGNYHHNNTPLQAPGLLTLEVAEEVL